MQVDFLTFDLIFLLLKTLKNTESAQLWLQLMFCAFGDLLALSSDILTVFILLFPQKLPIMGDNHRGKVSSSGTGLQLNF